MSAPGTSIAHEEAHHHGHHEHHHDDHHHEENFWTKYVFSQDHKMIAK